jgi:hypothetical protein
LCDYAQQAWKTYKCNMHRARLQDNFIFYDAWKGIASETLRTTDINQTVLDDLAQIGLTHSDIKQYTWVVDLKPEGIDHTDINHLFLFLTSQGLAPSQFRVAFSAVVDVAQLPYPAVCLPDRLIYNGNWYMHLQHFHVNWEELEITHKLVCLMRRPSVSRGNIAKRLLAKFHRDQLIMTFGTNGVEPSDDIKQLIWPQPYPMIVDRPMADQVFQHRIDHDRFYRAPVNLVVESSSQTDPNTWRSVFITEKTFKALAWHQFPIWYAVPGLVDQVRQLGFDVFDDVFDNHSYDSESDPWVRMTKTVLLAKHVCDQDLAQLRKTHWDRLQKNAKLVEKIHTEAITRHTTALNNLIYDT